MSPSRLSEELRHGQSSDLTRRRWIIGLSLPGVAAGQLVTMYETGIIRRLPNDRIGPIDSNKVNKSDYGYSRFGSPDAVPMIVNYGITAWLASAGGKNRAANHPTLPIALTAKAAVDLATTLKLGQEEWSENKKLCAYCQTATLASAVTLLLSLPETVAAFRKLTDRKPIVSSLAETARGTASRTRGAVRDYAGV